MAAATFSNVYVIQVGAFGALLDQPQQDGRGAYWIDATTVYDVTPDR